MRAFSRNCLTGWGEMPLPPYIHEKLADQSRYQTVYAKNEGSAAAPTAGLHFTPELLERIRAKGRDHRAGDAARRAGTFRPVQVEDVDKHVMHSEWYQVTEEAANTLNAIRASGGRLICVGTTSVRTIETVATEDGIVHPGAGDTAIFIYPGKKIKAVDALITNFHLPQSTLLMLVSTFMGRETALDVYREAVQKKYRFFSFGDAMFIDDETKNHRQISDSFSVRTNFFHNRAEKLSERLDNPVLNVYNIPCLTSLVRLDAGHAGVV